MNVPAEWPMRPAFRSLAEELLAARRTADAALAAGRWSEACGAFVGVLDAFERMNDAATDAAEECAAIALSRHRIAAGEFVELLAVRAVAGGVVN